MGSFPPDWDKSDNLPSSGELSAEGHFFSHVRLTKRSTTCFACGRTKEWENDNCRRKKELQNEDVEHEQQQDEGIETQQQHDEHGQQDDEQQPQDEDEQQQQDEERQLQNAKEFEQQQDEEGQPHQQQDEDDQHLNQQQVQDEQQQQQNKDEPPQQERQDEGEEQQQQQNVKEQQQQQLHEEGAHCLELFSSNGHEPSQLEDDGNGFVDHESHLPSSLLTGICPAMVLFFLLVTSFSFSWNANLWAEGMKEAFRMYITKKSATKSQIQNFD